jgi:hypothetical protein
MKKVQVGFAQRLCTPKTKISSLTNANTASQVVAMSKSIQIEARTEGGS